MKFKQTKACDLLHSLHESAKVRKEESVEYCNEWVLKLFHNLLE